jgi:hypothetical protein
MLKLVKLGVVERALKPGTMKARFHMHDEYLYRLTGRAFKPKLGHPEQSERERLDRGRRLQLDHPRLPKWFRDMMH